MLNWNEYLGELKTTIGKIAKISPDTIKGYQAITNAKVANPTLDQKTRELISLAVAVTARCDGCIAVHTEAAKKHGATQEEIVEALSVAVAINAGATLVYSARTLDAFNNIK